MISKERRKIMEDLKCLLKITGQFLFLVGVGAAAGMLAFVVLIAVYGRSIF